MSSFESMTAGVPAARRITIFLVCALTLGAHLPLAAQAKSKSAGSKGGAQKTAPKDSTVTLTRDPALQSMRWRSVGPYRGGRAVAVTGDPTRPRVFYFGSVNGGVWKTVDGGMSWRNITDEKSTISSVGAIAVAQSDPNVLYVGGGESDFREDLTYGDGMCRSTDAGETWQHLGLEDARHISIIRVDPRDPDVLYVAAMGHAFGPNAMRGVFRSRDGGKTWQKVLFVNDSTGAVDIALDPSNPRVLYAALWKFQRHPWGFTAGGGRSGLWKSLDAGDTWTEITGSKGLPQGDVGRIGITVSPAKPSRLWASVEAKDSAGGIFRSDYGGRTWTHVNNKQEFHIRPWYYSQLTADPVDENTVYVMNLDTWRSVDAGKTFARLNVPHGDDHELWIDPVDPKRMIEGNDGGATISFDAGETWTSQGNQPTAQFYHVITDSGFPYRIYGSQQDNSSVSVASRSDRGAITIRDWWPIGGGEAGYVALQPGSRPGDLPITYVGDYMGTIYRTDHRTAEVRDVSVWQNNWDGHAVADAPYRFQWTFPIVTSPHDAKVLYATAQNVFKSTDGGEHWTAISPDLTVHDPATMGPVGGPIHHDMTGTEWYATIFAFAESPITPGLLWAGSDDGLVHVSRDGGKSWTNVTPAALGKFTRVSIIEPSHFDAGTAYLAANRYQQDDFKPYLFKTTDYGKSWTKITTGIPEGAYTRVIREDVVRRGLLFAGTETGAYFSFDDGVRWRSLQLNLPRSSVRDLNVHGADLVAATHGRSFWVLDDISPLRQLADSVRKASVFVLAPQPAVRFSGGRTREHETGQNPPDGLIVDYWLRDTTTGEVTLAFLDSTGAEIRRFSSKLPLADSTGARSDSGRTTQPDTTASAKGAPNAKTAKPIPTDSTGGRARRIESGTDSLSYEPRDSVVSTRSGMNRFVWNLRYPSARETKGILLDEGTLTGPMAIPGRYSLKLTVNGTTYTRPFTIVPDPRLDTSPADYVAQLQLARQIVDKISAVSDGAARAEQLGKELDGRKTQTKSAPYAARVAQSADSISRALGEVRGELVEVGMQAYEASLYFPVKPYNQLITLNTMVQTAAARPTQGEIDSFKDLSTKVDAQLAKLSSLEGVQLAAFNNMMKELEVPAVGVRVEKAHPE